jgi:hypothetical protein
MGADSSIDVCVSSCPGPPLRDGDEGLRWGFGFVDMGVVLSCALGTRVYAIPFPSLPTVCLPPLSVAAAAAVAVRLWRSNDFYFAGSKMLRTGWKNNRCRVKVSSMMCQRRNERYFCNLIQQCACRCRGPPAPSSWLFTRNPAPAFGSEALCLAAGAGGAVYGSSELHVHAYQLGCEKVCM